jgi:hypothetical protein
MAIQRYYTLTLSEKLLYTSFLLLVGLGYLMATSYLYVTHEMNDGKPGLSVEDVASSYFGNRSGTRLEAAIRGPMSGFIDEEGRNVLVAWLKDGAEEEHFEKDIKPVLSKTCYGCHTPASGLKVPDFTTYAGLHQFAQVDTGMSLASLLRLSHIHLFGISMLLFVIGFIFIQSEVNVWFKRALVLAPMVAVFFDVASWFLTKWDSHYAIVVIVSGGMLGISMALQILISLYQIWFLKKPANLKDRDQPPLT